MGLLVGLPLKLFYLLFAVVRLVWPLLMIWLLVVILRYIRAGNRSWRRGSHREPEFDGPVYTVDYQEVEPSEEPDDL